MVIGKIIKITKIDKPEKVYNLHIEDNHNYFANGLNVSNCHLFKAKSLMDIMTKLVNAKYRIGTTGTLDGIKTHKLVLEGLFGTVHKVITTKELMDQKHLADFNIKCLLLKHNDSICQAAKNFTYQQEIEYLILNESRNKFIANLSLSLEGNTLLLYQYVEKHGKILFDLIEKASKGRKVFFIHGDTDVEIREQTRSIVDSHPINNEVIFEFDKIKIKCKKDDEIPLTNGNKKKAKYISENDDIDASWILNNSIPRE
jgi:hypothetical protein